MPNNYLECEIGELKKAVSHAFGRDRFGIYAGSDRPEKARRMITDMDEHFQGIWRRALNEFPLSALTPEVVESWAKERGLDVTKVEEREVGAFGKIPAIVLAVGDSRACFPKISVDNDQNWRSRRTLADAEAALWDKMEWFSPLWISKRDIAKILCTARHNSRQQALHWFRYHTSTLYTLPFQAICIAQILPQARSLSELCALAREAYLAFYSGYRASSIAALIPAIEGSLSRIASQSEQDVPIPTKIDRVIDRAIATAAKLHFEQMWVPREYLDKDYLFGQDERVFAFETFRRWLRNSFFRNTSEYDGVTWLNRHVFAHGTQSLWQQSSNFERLVVVLATLALIESWHDGTHRVSLIFPQMNEDSKLLWQQALARGSAQMGQKLREQRRYQKQGRLVPEMPTDDGALLRRALLTNDCINDLVRPLRNSGWNVEVGEPDESALYMTVVATARGECMTVGLLASCATDNVIYKRLAETCAAILYSGAPYQQQQFAYGINVHVGPVAGWRPPAPRNGRRTWRSYPIWRRFQKLKIRLAFAFKIIKSEMRRRRQRPLQPS